MQNQFTRTHSNMAKGLAILLLLAYHLFENEELITSMEVNYTPFSLEGFLCFSGFGNICVSMFVFLTAFGIARGLEGQWSPEGLCWKSAYGQAARRFLRLMLNFTILYASVSLLWWYKFDYQSLYGAGKQGVLPLLTDALGLSMFFGTPTLNDTWWYMEIAYLLIFLVPLLARLADPAAGLPPALRRHPPPGSGEVFLRGGLRRLRRPGALARQAAGLKAPPCAEMAGRGGGLRPLRPDPAELHGA